MPAKEAKVIREEGEGYRWFTDGTMMLLKKRISYPKIWELVPYTDPKTGNISYSVGINVLLHKVKDKPAFLAVKRRKDELIITSKTKDKAGNPIDPKTVPKEKLFLRDGDTWQNPNDFSTNPDYADHYFVACKDSKNPPLVYGRDKSTWNKSQHQNRIYGGCYCNVLIRPWWQDNGYGLRANCGFDIVQFVKDGTPFGAGRMSEDDGASLLDEAEDDDVDYSSDDDGGI